VAWRLLPSPTLASSCSKARERFVCIGTWLALSSLYKPELIVHYLPSRAPCGALAFVSLVMCLQGLPLIPQGLSLVVRHGLSSCSLHATASPSLRGLVSFPASLIGLAVV